MRRQKPTMRGLGLLVACVAFAGGAHARSAGRADVKILDARRSGADSSRGGSGDPVDEAMFPADPSSSVQAPAMDASQDFFSQARFARADVADKKFAGLGGMAGKAMTAVGGSNKKGKGSGAGSSAPADNGTLKITAGSDAPGAPPCCQICPAKMLLDLQLLQLDETSERSAVRNFAVWHAVARGASARDAAAVAHEMERARATHRSAGHEAALLELGSGTAVRKFLGGLLGGGSSGKSGKGGEDFLVPGQRCCPLCPVDYVPPPGMSSLLEVSAGVLAANLTQHLGCSARAAAGSCPAAPRSLRPAPSSVLLEEGSKGIFSSLMGGGGGENTPKPWVDRRESVCCNVCPASFHPPGRSPAGVTIGASLLETGARQGFFGLGDSGGLDIKGGMAGPKGYDGCCKLCASKFYGPGGWGAPPFSEPGSESQHSESAGISISLGSKGPEKKKKEGGFLGGLFG